MRVTHFRSILKDCFTTRWPSRRVLFCFLGVLVPTMPVGMRHSLWSSLKNCWASLCCGSASSLLSSPISQVFCSAWDRVCWRKSWGEDWSRKGRNRALHYVTGSLLIFKIHFIFNYVFVFGWHMCAQLPAEARRWQQIAQDWIYR